MVNLRRSSNRRRSPRRFHAENAKPRRRATTPPPVGAGRRAAGTSIERQHGHTSGFGALCRLCVRAAARSMPRAARPPAGDACHFSPRDSASPRPLRDIVSALSAIFASDDKVISVSLLSHPDVGDEGVQPLPEALANRVERCSVSSLMRGLHHALLRAVVQASIHVQARDLARTRLDTHDRDVLDIALAAAKQLKIEVRPLRRCITQYVAQEVSFARWLRHGD